MDVGRYQSKQSREVESAESWLKRNAKLYRFIPQYQSTKVSRAEKLRVQRAELGSEVGEGEQGQGSRGSQCNQCNSAQPKNNQPTVQVTNVIVYQEEEKKTNQQIQQTTNAM